MYKRQGLNYLCKGYYKFFDHVAPYMDFMKKELLAEMCIRDRVNAAREPHPHLIEVKKNYQYMKAALTDRRNLSLKVKNWYDFTNLNAYTLHWQVVGCLLYTSGCCPLFRPQGEFASYH